MSNYTATMSFKNENDVKIKFLSQSLNKRAFIGAQLIKKDLREFTANEPELIDEERLKYFHHNLQTIELDKVINIDLKNAYATVLFNDGFISEKTYAFLLTLPKKDRLASVGFLAYKKDVFEFNDGGLIDHSVEKGPNANVFHYCVRKTHLIMDNISKILGDDFLFSWVDGIYFKDISEKTIKIVEYLESIQYKHTIDTLVNFKCSDHGRFLFVSFDKEGGKKIFNVPKSTYMWQNDFYKFVNNKYK